MFGGPCSKLANQIAFFGGITARPVEHGLPGARIPADADGEFRGHSHADLNRTGIQRHAGHVCGPGWAWDPLAQDDAAQVTFNWQVQPDPNRLDVRLR